MRNKLLWLLLLAAVGLMIWSTDAITLQGERTVYTVNCSGGDWIGHHCNGRLQAGPRYRYRVLMAHGEVLFWIAGSQEPSGRFVRCDVTDGRNWTCPPSNADASRSVTLAMVRGKPAENPAWPTRPLHPVSKLTWVLLDVGLSTTQNDGIV